MHSRKMERQRQRRRIQAEVNKIFQPPSAALATISSHDTANQTTTAIPVEIDRDLISDGQYQSMDWPVNQQMCTDHTFDCGEPAEDWIYDHETDMTDNTECNTYTNTSLSELLCDWMIRYSITQNAGTALLKLLHSYLPDLPLDSRTLLGNMKQVRCKEVGGGLFYYFGLIECISQVITASSPQHLSLQLNVDGLPLYKSSSSQLWPILIRVNQSNPIVLALFYGEQKPQDLDSYLEDLISDISNYCRSGFTLFDKQFTLQLQSFVCDAPARSFLKRTTCHTGYNSCERCCVRGTRVERRTVFLGVDHEARTSVAFDELKYEGVHQSGKSPLIGLVDCINGFVLDYMHLVCLGVVRRMVSFWRRGTNPARLKPSSIQCIAERLQTLRGHLPSNFARQPRSILESDRWKASEFRSFLLYTGVVVLEGVLPVLHYQHFCTLSVAISILLDDDSNTRNHLLNYSRELLRYFVSECSQLYGEHFVTYNVHSLIHLPDDCNYHQCSLNALSAFPYENMLGQLKKMIRSPLNPLAQLVKRLSNKRYVALNYTANASVVGQSVSSRFRDSFAFLFDGSLVQVIDICNDHVSAKVIPAYLHKSVFHIPADSKTFGILSIRKSQLHQLAIKSFSVSSIKQKAVVLDSSLEQFTVCMLRHHLSASTGLV